MFLQTGGAELGYRRGFIPNDADYFAAVAA
jgi:hypothetical protein